MMDALHQSKDIESIDFQAEVKQVLDIVINSLYTERDIFVRELISNASDALEKFRLVSLMESEVNDSDLPLEITIDVDSKEKSLIVADTGIGMTREELIENLGTIAHSGSREFLKNLTEGDRQNAQLIGQFGVGFYSAFMVASHVRVQTRSFKPDAKGWEWKSDGTGSYSITPMEGLKRGTKIILSLKEDAAEYSEADRIRNIIKQYSNFVSFDIKVNGEKVNTIQAIWLRNKNEISEEDYQSFFKFLTNSFMNPMYRLHLSSDAPIQLNALFFIPSENPEQFGFGRLEPGVNLYSRKVLIQQNFAEMLPEYLRFVKGVVDSEDLPLNISRETIQNSRIIRRMSRFLTKRLISFLEEEAAKDKDKYRLFWDKFSMFIKEGCVNDSENREQLSKLLLYQSSRGGEEEMVSLSDYVSRMKEGQAAIYYLNGPSREIIESGPYLEAFRQRDMEVLYLLDPADDFVMTAIHEFQGKKLISVDQSELELPPVDTAKPDEPMDALSPEEVSALTKWMKELLGETVSDVRESQRLTDSPAMIVNPDSMLTTTMQRILKASDKNFGGINQKVLEINPRHSVLIKLAKLRENGSDEELLKSCVEQIADNAYLAAGIPGSRGTMIQRIYKIMEKALEGEGNQR